MPKTHLRFDSYIILWDFFESPGTFRCDDGAGDVGRTHGTGVRNQVEPVQERFLGRSNLMKS